MRNESPLWTPNIPTRVADPDTTTTPERRLSPDTLCDDQKSRVVRRIIRELPG